MIHSFDMNIASKYGIHEAILLNHLYFWIEKNRANEKHFYDGYYWTYSSKRALSELFPYLTERQIGYALEKLISAGIIIKGNYNKSGYDKTLWYAITEKGYSIIQNCQMERTVMSNRCDNNVEWNEQDCLIEDTNLSNGMDEDVEPIPDIITDNKTDIVADSIINNHVDEVKLKRIDKVIHYYNNYIDPLRCYGRYCNTAG